jgi:hypothetical protein
VVSVTDIYRCIFGFLDRRINIRLLALVSLMFRPFWVIIRYYIIDQEYLLVTQEFVNRNSHRLVCSILLCYVSLDEMQHYSFETKLQLN